MFAPASRPACRISRPRFRLYTTIHSPPSSRNILSKAKTAAKFAGFVCASSVIGILVVGTGILAHDAFTYTDKHVSRVPVNPLALHPERGGPKNLPIARVLIDDEEDEEAKLLAVKPKLVIIGGGWGVRSFIRCFSMCSIYSTGDGCSRLYPPWRLSYHARFYRYIHHVHSSSSLSE
jgi:hypothetical protein